MEKDAAEEVTELLVHDEDTAGGMMGTEYVAFPPDTTVAEAFARLRVLAREAELITDVFVVGPHEELLGSLSLRDLLAADDDAPLEQVMRSPPGASRRTLPAKDVIELDGEVRPPRAARSPVSTAPSSGRSPSRTSSTCLTPRERRPRRRLR